MDISFTAFLAALGTQWVSLMTGGLGALAIGFILLFIGQRWLAVGVWIVGAVLLLVWASYLLWCKDQSDKQTLNGKLSDLESAISKMTKEATPDFVGDIGLIVYNGNPSGPNTNFLLNLSLSNHGAAASATGYWLEVISESLHLSVPAFPVTDVPGFPASMNVHKETALDEKTINPVVRGATVRGWLRFVHPVLPAT